MCFSAAASSSNDQGSMNLDFEYRSSALHYAVEGGSHPRNGRVFDAALNVFDVRPLLRSYQVRLSVLGRDTKLHDEVAGHVLRLNLAALFPPKPNKGGFIPAHDYPGIRAADEGAAVPC